MPGLMDYLRLKNIFAPPVIGNDLPSQGGYSGNMGNDMPVSPSFADAFKPKSDPYGNIRIGPDMSATTQMPVASPQDDFDVQSRMKELYTPESAATDRFNKMVGDYPNRADYKPSVMRRIAGALTATAGQFGGRHHSFAFNPQAIGAGESIMDEPYTDKLTDWKNQIGPAQSAAQLERQNNINERTMAYQTVSGELRQHAADAKAANDATKAQIAEHRAQIYEYKAKHPGLKVIMSKGGNVQLVDPATGQVTDTGVPTGSMTELDKLNLQQDNAMEQIQGRGDQARQTENVRAGNQQQQIEMRGWKVGSVPDPNDPSKQIGVQYNEITGEVKPISFGGNDITGITKPSTGGRTGGSELPTQTRVRQFSTARQLANSRPDLAKFIKLGPGATDFNIVAPGTGMFGNATGPTKEQYDQINEAIYGKGNLQVQQPQATHTSTQNTGNNPAPKAGNQAKRQQAIDILTQNKKPVTEANIAHVLAQLK